MNGTRGERKEPSSGWKEETVEKMEAFMRDLKNTVGLYI